MSSVVGTKVVYAPDEASDYDVVAMCVLDDTQYFNPVQLKELHPASLNPDASLDELSLGLAKYAPTDTILAIKLNQARRIDFTELDVSETPFREVWFFACTSPDQNSWVIVGDVGGERRVVEFRYPGT